MAIVLVAGRKQTEYTLRLLVFCSNLLLHSHIRCRHDSRASGLHVFMGRLLRPSLPRLVVRFQTTSSELNKSLVLVSRRRDPNKSA